MDANELAAGIRLINGPLEIKDAVSILGNGVSIIRDGSVFQAFVVNLTSGGTGEPNQTLIQNLDVRGFIQAVHIQNVHAGGVVTINDNTIHDNKALQPDAPAPTYERAAIEVVPFTAPPPELTDFDVRITNNTIYDNSFYGIYAHNAAGGKLTISGNTIYDHSLAGIRLYAFGTRPNITGNNIGYNPDTGLAASNQHGVEIDASAWGMLPGEGRGVISNNVFAANSIGLLVRSTFMPALDIEGNFVGVNRSENAFSGSANQTGVYLQSSDIGYVSGNAVGYNSQDGMYVSYSNAIGIGPRTNFADPSGRGNRIFKNGGSGVVISGLLGGYSENILVYENFIGTKLVNGQYIDLGNSGSGVVIDGYSSRSTVSGNTIGFNSLNGITVTATGVNQNVLRGNTFLRNVGLPIDIGGSGQTGDGPTPNDPDDADGGANNRLNFPVIAADGIKFFDGSWQIPVRIDVDQTGTYRVDLYKVVTHGSGATAKYDYIYLNNFVEGGSPANGTIAVTSLVSYTPGGSLQHDGVTTIVIPPGTGAGMLAAGDVIVASAVGLTGGNVNNASEISRPSAIVANNLARVADVLLDGSAWAATVPPISYGPLVQTGQQLRPIARQNVNEVHIRFNQNVRLFVPGVGTMSMSQVAQLPSTVATQLLGLVRTSRMQPISSTPYAYNTATDAPLNGGNPTPLVASAFRWDAVNFTAIWTFPSLVDGKYAIHLGAGVNNRPSVIDVAQITLDGDWINPDPSVTAPHNTPFDADTGVNVFQASTPRSFAANSGDGQPGAVNNVFRFHFSLLAGDYSGDGVVNDIDVAVPGNLATDGNGDGAVDAGDNQVVTNNKTRMLPFRDRGGADFVDNDYIDAGDLSALLAAFGSSALGDSTGDNATDGADVLGLATALGTRSVWNKDSRLPIAPLAMASGEEPAPGPPKVTNVIVKGSQSTHAPFSFDAVDGSGLQLRTVPVGGADTISIIFNKEVNVTETSLIVMGLRTANVPSLASFTYDSATNAATWRFTGWALADQYLLALSDEITDVENHYNLDGEWTNPASVTTVNAAVSEFPSGNGQPGGWFKFVMTLLPGDANLTNDVTTDDLDVLLANLGLPGRLFTQGDFSGNGLTTFIGDGMTYFYPNLLVDLRSVWLLADFDGDFDVDDDDLAVIDAHFGMLGATWADGDLNGDGLVTMDDGWLALAQYGLDFDVVA